jgi:hypothetical protein
MVGVIGHPLIFIDEYLLAEIGNGSYAKFEVPQGTVVVAATAAYTSHIELPSPTGPGFWRAIPGCVGLDWRRLAAAEPSDIALCSSGLDSLVRQCGIYTTIRGCSGPGCVQWITEHIPACNYKLDGCPADIFNLLKLAAPVRLALTGSESRGGVAFTTLNAVLRVDVEAGKTYYLKWSVSGSGGKMMLADGPVGAKEIKKLNLAKP